MTRLSTLLAASCMVSQVVFFVEKKITNACPTSCKQHGPEIIRRKIRNFFWAYGLINHGKRRDLTVWYPIFREKTKKGSTHAFNKKQTKQYHYEPLTIITIHGTPLHSNRVDWHIDNNHARRKERQRSQRRYETY